MNYKTILWLTVFSLAMGFLETAVVVYLRGLYYPNGFEFPLQPIDPGIALTEFLREAATVIMLLAIGVLAGQNIRQRFAGFLFCFAIWDLSYYLFLKLLLDWPSSLLTWDILFLIPVPWVGPVLAPCLVALAMIGLALLLWQSDLQRGYLPRIPQAWWLMVLGCVLILVTFMQDYVAQAIATSSYWSPGSDRALFSEIDGYIPQEYNWSLFWVGYAGIVAGLGLLWKQIVRPAQVARHLNYQAANTYSQAPSANEIIDREINASQQWRKN